METAVLTALSALLLAAVLIDHSLRRSPNPRPIYALTHRPRARRLGHPERRTGKAEHPTAISRDRTT